MAQRRLSLTTRGAIASGLAPVSAVAGVLLGAEELVLLSIGLLTLMLSGLVQSAHRARRARGNWRVTAKLTTSDAEVGGLADLAVTLATAGDGGATPVWLEATAHGWRRVRRGTSGEPMRSRLPNPTLALWVPHLESGGTVEFGFPAPTENRGVYALRGLRLWCFDSFGLVAQTVAVGPSATITVHPTPATNCSGGTAT
jgi:hypothetical protein